MLAGASSSSSSHASNGAHAYAASVVRGQRVAPTGRMRSGTRAEFAARALYLLDACEVNASAWAAELGVSQPIALGILAGDRRLDAGDLLALPASARATWGALALGDGVALDLPQLDEAARVLELAGDVHRARSVHRDEYRARRFALHAFLSRCMRGAL